MFGWLKIRTPKPTTPAAAEPQRGLPQPPSAAGNAPLTLDTDTLKPHPLFSLLPVGALDRLLADSALAEYPKGTVIYREGDPCDAIYLILSGRCEERRRELGGELVDAVAGPGDMLGDRAILNREVHRHSAVVATHALLLRVPASELQGLFATDPRFASRFSQTVTEWPRARHDGAGSQAGAVRRVVSLLSLATRLDAEAVVARLAQSLRQLTGRQVLIVRLARSAEGPAIGQWPAREAVLRAEFHFARHLRRREEGIDELPLSIGAEPGEAAAIAPLISHCARHYPFVLLDLRPDVPAPATIQTVIESDLTYVLLQPSTQNLYDFKLLIHALDDRACGACNHVKPILCAEESIAAPEFDATLRQLGHPAHAVVRGFPLCGSSSSPDHRFDLQLRRLAREIARCRIGLALSSGGAKGLAHIGVIQVLEENGIEIDCVAGSSMGAYVGATWAYGLDGAMLEKTAREVEGRWGLRYLIDPVLLPRRGFIRTRRTIKRLRNSIGLAHFSELIRPLRVVATQLDSLERVVFSTGEVARAVEASIAIPGVCVPVTLDGETYIDGGISDPLPVDVLEEMGIERIIAVNVIPPPERIRYWLDSQRELNGREPQPSRISRFVRTHLDYSASGNILDTMMRAINGAQTRVAEAAARQADVVVRPIAGGSVWHDFTRPQRYIALGRAAAEEQLAELQALARPPSYEPEKPLALTPTLAA